MCCCRWNLTWWEQHAPVVISSYSTRTLLGAPAFCPTQPDPALTGSSGKSDRDSSSNRDQWLMLRPVDVEVALQQLYTFDVVLELNSQDLIDLCISKLLGWSGQMFSTRPRERKTAAPRVLTWQQLEQLATQQPPAAAAASAAQPNALSGNGSSTDVDIVRRMVAEYQIREVYSNHQVQYVITPLLPGHKPPQEPPASARTAALAALHRVNQSDFSIMSSKTVEGEIVVQMQGRSTDHGQHRGTPAAAQTATATSSASSMMYHIWPRHGVVLSEQQYKALSQLTTADKQLHKHAQLLQLVDAAWLTALSQHTKYAKLISQLIDVDDREQCGLAAS